MHGSVPIRSSALFHVTRLELGQFAAEKDRTRAGALDRHRNASIAFLFNRRISISIASPVVSKRYAKANNPLVEGYAPCKPNKYIMYFDRLDYQATSRCSGNEPALLPEG